MSYVASGRCVRQHGVRFHQPGKGPWKEGPWIIGASHQGKAALPREASEHVGASPGCRGSLRLPGGLSHPKKHAPQATDS